MKTIVGIFDNRDAAEMAAQQVKEQGLRTDDISILAKEGTDTDQAGGNTRTGGNATNNRPINDNISDGTIAGGVLGGAAGLLLGMGTMIIPGLGVIAAAGPIAGLLTGALTGGVVGGMVDLGIPEASGRKYEADIRQGKIMWTMKTDQENVNKISDILRTCGAENVEVH